MRSATTTRRAGFTLVEIMVVVGIIVVLVAILLPALNAVRERAKADKVRTQMQLIAMAIEEYARFWPPSRGADVNGDGVMDPCTPRSSRGLPPWDFADFWSGELTGNGAEADFELSNTAPVPDDIPLFWTDSDVYDRKRGMSEGNQFAALQAEADIYESNECLAWCLTAPIGLGPYLKSPPSGLVEYIPYDPGVYDPNRVYPLHTDLQSDPNYMKGKRRLIDPWGTPYFYCWKASDGVWLIWRNLGAPEDTNPRVGGFVWNDDQNVGTGFALLSAGPDKRFYFMAPPSEDFPAGTLDVSACGPDGIWGTDDDHYDTKSPGLDETFDTADDLENDDIVFGRGG